MYHTRTYLYNTAAPRTKIDTLYRADGIGLIKYLGSHTDIFSELIRIDMPEKSLKGPLL